MRAFRFVIILLIVTAVLAYGLCPRPELHNFLPCSRAYFDGRGDLLRLTLAGDERYRVFEDLEKISPEFIEATILYEDQQFYDHTGVDIMALLRAFWTTYIAKERRVGASTLTMQVARLRWGISSDTVLGKLYQIIKAIQLTRHYAKPEILEAYLNLAPYGRNIEGIGTASLIYFNKKPGELSLPEALTLAVIPQNPNKRNPTSANGYRRLLKARSLLMARWLETHPEDMDKAKFFDLPLNIRPPEKLPFTAPHFIDYLNRQIPHWKSGHVNTTLDGLKQKSLESNIAAWVGSNRAIGINNAAALLLNYETMVIVAMVGSADFYDKTIQGQVNGVSAKRSPGSALKPFVYALAMDEGLVHPLSLMKDSPRKFGGFTPENYDKQFLGPISVKDALIQSRNVPAVEIQSQLKNKSFYQFLVEGGVSGLKNESFYGLALALGGGEVTMLELASLYAILANQGISKPVHGLKEKIKGPQKQLLSREASFLVLDILKDNPAPDQLDVKGDQSQQNEIAWKTGTSWAFRDAWAAGVSGPYVLVVWVGNFDGSGNDAFVGRRAAGPLMFSIFDSVYPGHGWKVSDTVPIQNLNLKRLLICSASGDLYERDCPSSQEAWFIPGVSPIKVSDIYRKIPINKKTGLRACWHKEGVSELKVYEFWPSDFLQIYNQAGISLKTPPQYESDCDLDLKSTTGQKPVITSPQSTIEYVIRTESKDDNLIPFKAIVDPDVRKVHWFVDDVYVGSMKGKEALLWKGRLGKFMVRAVDDYGRVAVKPFVVNRMK